MLRNDQILKELTIININSYGFISFFSAGISAALVLILLKTEATQYAFYLYFFTSLTTTIYCFATLKVIINLSLRFFNIENKIINYLSDSSYFIYIVHIPVVILFQRAVYFLEWHPIFKWITVSFFSYVVLFLVYHLIVRHTPIGHFLHGPK
ncbi:MAG: acyltransferase family protein [Bacteriovoracaceae bacterium]|nr:acyltransferase family protein [Bacteriovoracaceae bacterium]